MMYVPKSHYSSKDGRRKITGALCVGIGWLCSLKPQCSCSCSYGSADSETHARDNIVPRLHEPEPEEILCMYVFFLLRRCD